MASRVAVQGLGTFSVPLLLSVGKRLLGLIGLSKVLVMRLPLKDRSCRKFEDECLLYLLRHLKITVAILFYQIGELKYFFFSKFCNYLLL